MRRRLAETRHAVAVLRHPTQAGLGAQADGGGGLGQALGTLQLLVRQLGGAFVLLLAEEDAAALLFATTLSLVVVLQTRPEKRLF